MKNPKTNKLNYFKNIALIALIIILISLIIIYNKRDNKFSINSDSNNMEIIVRDSSISDTQNNSGQDSSKTVDSSQFGPATVQDLGGSSNSSNIDELLKGKEIEVGK